MKKLLYGIATFITTAVLCVISAGAVSPDYGASGTTTTSTSDIGVDGTMHIIYNSALGLVDDASLDLEPTDFVSAHVYPTDPDADTSDWVVAFNAFDTTWNGWGAVVSEEGSLDLYCQVSDLMNIIYCEDISEFGGFLFQVWGTEADVSIDWEIYVETPPQNPATGGDEIDTETEFTYGDFNYKITEDACIYITGYTGTDTDVVIPSMIGYKVTAIGNNAFAFNKNIETVTIPEGVTSIGYEAFYCSSLTSIIIPDSVTSIGSNAFGNCSSLTSITIPDSVTSIGTAAFSFCTSLVSITIPDSVTSIGGSAFYWCTSLTSITIPDSVTSIGNSVFYGCTSLISISVDTGNAYYTSSDGILFNKSKTHLIQYPAGKKATTYTIPYSITNISGGAFSYCSSLTSITIPDSVTSIGSSAFNYCSSLTSVTIPESVTSIGYAIFEECSSLASITIPDSVTSIGDFFFYRCSSLTSITIPDSVTSIGKNAFFYCSSLTSITIPDSVTSIDDYAFIGCSSLETLVIPEGVTSIGEHAFNQCTNLKSISLPDSVKGALGEGTFFMCESLTSIEIPDGITSIGYRCFEECTSLTTVIIGKGVTDIEAHSFDICPNLTKFIVPDNVTFMAGRPVDNPSDTTGYGTIFGDTLGAGETSTNSVVTIYCNKGSYAEKYAKLNGYKYSYNITPDAISGFASKSRNYNSITLNWAQNSTASGYIIQQYKNNTWTNIANIKSNATTSYQITGLAANTSYKFRAVAYATLGSTTAYSSYTSALTVSTAPAMTTGFAITGRGSDFLTITWTKNTGASGYIIQEQVNGVWKNVASIKGNTTVSHKIANLQPNSFHRYRMVAYKTDANGTCYGKYTGSAPGYTAPAMVSGFKVSAIGTNNLTVSWTKVASANGYVIDIYKDGKWSQLAKITSNATTSYKATGLNVGTTYKFRIKSYATNGTLTIYSTYSSAISGVPAISAPTNLTMTNRGTDFISVRWDKNADADGYMVYVYTNGSWLCVKTLTSNSAVSNRINGLESGTIYKIAVKSYKTVNGTRYVSGTTTISAVTL